MENIKSDVETVELVNGNSVKILAWDYSGSTNDSRHYHKIGKSYLNDFAKKYVTTSPDDEPLYLTWSTCCLPVTLQELRNICQKREGTGGTYPTSLIEWIMHYIPKEILIELWLITDGEIDEDELKKCALLNQEVNYSQINFISINQHKINMSVGASFFRGAQLRIFTNDVLLKEINTSKPFDYEFITLENFDSQCETLNDFIQAKFMGSDIESLEEVEKLSALRRRLLKSLDDEHKNDLAKGIDCENQDTVTKDPDFSSRKTSDLLAALKSCQFYKSLVSTDVRIAREYIDSNISNLINYIHNKHRSYDFESLKVEHKQSKIEDVDELAEPDIDDLNVIEMCTLFDAVTLENEESVPVLLIAATDLIKKYWLDGNFTKFRATMDCPLIGNIDNCIGHVYTYATFKSLCNLKSGIIMDPSTNQPAGGIIFDKSADKWNDYMLATLFFQGKKINTCIALWYYKIWQCAKKSPWIESAVVDMLRSYTFRRIKNAKVKLAFGRLPLDPKELVPIHVACYYCTEGSTLLFGQDSTLFGEERLRQYWSVAESMLEILEYFKYDEVDKEFVMKRAKVFENMTHLKRIPQEMERRYFLLKNVFESKGDFLIPVVKDHKAVGFMNLLQYHHITSMIPFNFDKSPADITSWLLVSYDRPVPEAAKLCLESCRPYFVLKADSNDLVPNYSQLFNHISEITLDHKGEILCKSPVTKLNQSKLISGYKLYIDLTMRLKRFPTIKEYSAYTWKKKKFYGSKVRLFNSQIKSNIDEVFALYEKLGVGVEEFIEKTKRSVNISDRIKMEDVLSNQNPEEFIIMAKELLVQELPSASEQVADLRAQNKKKKISRNPNRKTRKSQKKRTKIIRRYRRYPRRIKCTFSGNEDLEIGDKTRFSGKYIGVRKDKNKRRKKIRQYSRNVRQMNHRQKLRQNVEKKKILCRFFNDDDFFLPT